MSQSHTFKNFPLHNQNAAGAPLNQSKRRKLTTMKLSEFFGWIIGALDLAFMVYSVVDLTPFILMVGMSLVYIAVMIIKNRKLNARAS